MFDILIRGGKIIDGTGNPWYAADLGIAGGRIGAIGRLGDAEAATTLDATGKVVTPGFIDTHVHGDIALLADPYHEAAIRQGVTTYLLGQDGVAMAPASAATLAYMRKYTAGFSGTWPVEQTWSSMADYLDLFNRRCAVNVACLIPNGNLRMEVMGLDTRPPSAGELRRMGAMVRAAMEQGAVGISSGMDYIPSRYAEVEELTALCRDMAPYGGVYVTHMWAYHPEGVLGSMERVYSIGRGAGVPVHISHFNSKADVVIPKLDAGRAAGIDVTFDLYCYLRGSTILAMVSLPPWVQEGGIDATLWRLHDPEVRAQLRRLEAPWKVPLEEIRLTFVAPEQYRGYEGKSLGQLADETGQPPIDVVCDVLIASNMTAGCTTPHLARGEGDIEALMRHPAMMGGSDGIFCGGCPHPRGHGCYARYLGHYVRDCKTWTLETAVQRLAAHAASRFGLRDRGLLREGLAADLVVFDPDTITDHATYEDGRRLATGVEHVAVNGELVLHAGERTKALPGRPLKRGGR